MWHKAAAMGGVVSLFARVFRLLDWKSNPVIYIRELQDAADGIETEPLFKTIHQRVNPLAARPTMEVVDPGFRLRDQNVIGEFRQPGLIPRPLLAAIKGF